MKSAEAQELVDSLAFLRYNPVLMTIEQLRKILQHAPFVPFDIHLADGRTLAVQHPENVAITGGGRTVGVADTDETIEIIDLLLVTSLKPQSNGKKPRSSPRKKR